MLKRLFGIFSRSWNGKKESPIAPKEYPVEIVGVLKRQRIEDFPWAGCMVMQYRYWCPCGTELTDGPQGGCATNAVCKKCRINYGCLLGYFEH